MKKDYYEILGVPRTAGDKQIKAAITRTIEVFFIVVLPRPSRTPITPGSDVGRHPSVRLPETRPPSRWPSTILSHTAWSNPKHEARNPKQIQISKLECSRPVLLIGSRFRGLKRVSKSFGTFGFATFGFRISLFVSL